MKKALKVFVCLAVLFGTAAAVTAQPSSKSIETIVLENFDNVGSQNYAYGGEQLNWEWGVSASRFIAEGYPKTNYFKGMPNPLRQLARTDTTDAQVFGVKTAYNRKGDNWFEVYPTQDGKPYEIPFAGTVTMLDFWVWGANYNYYLEVLVRDANGRVHVLPAGNLAFQGWRNITVNVPTWILQHSLLRSGPKDLTFVGFRVRTDAEEYVDNFVIYFDQIKYTSNSLAVIYDGYELRDADFGDSTDEVTE